MSRKVIIRQPKDNPEGWHVAGQGMSEEKARDLAKQMARAENKSFGVNQHGDCLGNQTSFLVLDKEDVVNGYNQNR